MLKCHPGFSVKLEILKYGIQVIYFLLGLFFHFALLKVLTRKRAVYSKFAFLKLYYIDSVLSVLIIFINVGSIRIMNYIPPLCPWAMRQYPEPSQSISLLYIEQYLKFSKCLIFCFMMINRANSVLCPMTFTTIQRCIIPHVVIFSILTPSIGVWTVFLSESQLVPFQGGFTPETKMSFNWITVSQFSAIISSITIGVAVTCSLISMICMSRARSENKHTQQSLTASALCQSIFYVLVLSMEIYFNKSKPSSIETAEFWKALTAFSFDILLVLKSPNVRLRSFYSLYILECSLNIISIFTLLTVKKAFMLMNPMDWFSNSSFLLNFVWIHDYIQLSKFISHSLLAVNRATCVMIPLKYPTVWSKLIPYSVIFTILAPIFGFWNVFLTKSYIISDSILKSEEETHLHIFKIFMFYIIIFTILSSSFVTVIGILKKGRKINRTEKKLCLTTFLTTFNVIGLAILQLISVIEEGNWKQIAEYAYNFSLCIDPLTKSLANSSLRTKIFGCAEATGNKQQQLKTVVQNAISSQDATKNKIFYKRTD